MSYLGHHRISYVSLSQIRAGNLDFSITLGGGRYGIAFALYDPAAFTSRFGTPPTPLLPPGDALGNTQHIANWSAKLRKYNLQVDEHLPKQRTAILMVLQEVLEPLKDEYGSLSELCTKHW